MFGQYFGRFLLKQSVVKAEDIAGITDLSYPAFNEALLEKTYLSKSEISIWLDEFKAVYRLSDENLRLFDNGNIGDIIPMFADINAVLHEEDSIIRFIKTYQADKHLTDEEVLEQMETHAIENILPAYLLRDPATYTLFIRESLRVMSEYYFIEPIFDKLTATHILDIDFLACQEMKGTHNGLFGISGELNALLSAAEKYAGQKFTELSPLAIDTLCEITNTVCGIFISELSNPAVSIEIQPPTMYSNKVLCSNNYIYCLPVDVRDGRINMIYSFDSDVRFLNSEKGGSARA